MPTKKAPIKTKGKEIKKEVIKKEKLVEDNFNNVETKKSITKNKLSKKSLFTILGSILLISVIVLIFIFSKNGTTNTEIKQVKNWDTISVDYVWKLEDGTIFDASIEEFAKKTKNYSEGSGRKYEPLEFTVWAGQMIVWFDSGVIWMKVGEKKTLKIEPKDAYWEKETIQTVPSKYLSDNIEQEVPAESFQDLIIRTFPADALGLKQEEIVVGKEINSQGVSWKITEISASWVTLEIQNTQNPFFGKKLAVWLEAEYQWNTITIKSISNDTVMVNILNKQNPFYGKELKVGLEWTLPNWQNVKITKVNGDDVEISMPNTHELAWKTLIFDVEVKSIK